MFICVHRHLATRRHGQYLIQNEAQLYQPRLQKDHRGKDPGHQCPVKDDLIYSILMKGKSRVHRLKDIFEQARAVTTCAVQERLGRARGCVRESCLFDFDGGFSLVA